MTQKVNKIAFDEIAMTIKTLATKQMLQGLEERIQGEIYDQVQVIAGFKSQINSFSKTVSQEIANVVREQSVKVRNQIL